MEIREMLHVLCEDVGPSGYERKIAEKAKKMIEPYVDEAFVDRLGNLIATKKCGKKNAKKFAIAAHLDEIGFIVTGYDDGFLTFTTIGGIDARLMPSRDVLIHTKPARVGVVCALPPHVLSASDMEKAIPMENLRIDAGLSGKELEKEIPVGTIITFTTQGFELGDDLYCSKTLDDRACFVSLIKAAEYLKDEKLPWDVVFIGSTGEEIGGGGAAAATYTVNPDVCMAIDVTHGWTPDAKESDRTFEMGGGPTVTIGPNCTRSVSDRMLSLAKEHCIPSQIEIQAGRTGTDAWYMQIVREGIATGLIGLPLKYMHTPVETVSIKDIDYCARLVAEYAKDPGEEVLTC